MIHQGENYGGRVKVGIIRRPTILHRIYDPRVDFASKIVELGYLTELFHRGLELVRIICHQLRAHHQDTDGGAFGVHDLELLLFLGVAHAAHHHLVFVVTEKLVKISLTGVLELRVEILTGNPVPGAFPSW